MLNLCEFTIKSALVDDTFFHKDKGKLLQAIWFYQIDIVYISRRQFDLSECSLMTQMY